MEDKPKIGLYGMGGWPQLFFFLFLTFTGYMVAVTATLLFVDVTQLWESARTMRMALTIQSICLFLLPALCFVFQCQEKPKEYLKTENSQNWTFFILAIFLIIICQPVISAIGYYNNQLSLPESMASIEKWMRESELSAEKTVGMLFADKTVLGLIFNLFVIAIIAGLAEEFFFRGCLQQIIQKIVKNSHVAIWVTAFIFSAIHFQFYGFVPRLLLGALFGYLFVWLGSIWIPVAVHTINNVIGVIVSYYYYGTPDYNSFDNYSVADNIWYILPCFIISFVLIYVLYKKKVKERIV